MHEVFVAWENHHVVRMLEFERTVSSTASKNAARNFQPTESQVGKFCQDTGENWENIPGRTF